MTKLLREYYYNIIIRDAGILEGTSLYRPQNCDIKHSLPYNIIILLSLCVYVLPLISPSTKINGMTLIQGVLYSKIQNAEDDGDVLEGYRH